MSTLPKRFLLLAGAPLLVAATFAMAQTTPAPDAAPATEPPAATAEQDAERAPTPRGERGFFKHPGRGPGHHGGPGGAFGGPDLMRGVFAEADADGDGRLSQEEVDAFLAAQLDAADSDGDGQVSIQEFEPVWVQRVRPVMVRHFQALDADGDGAITAEELDARFGDVVSRLDRTGDGTIGLDDYGRRGERR